MSEPNRRLRRVLQNSKGARSMKLLRLTSDSNSPPRDLTIDEVIALRPWSLREQAMLSYVAEGITPRLSTDIDGVPCDIELAPALEEVSA